MTCFNLAVYFNLCNESVWAADENALVDIIENHSITIIK